MFEKDQAYVSTALHFLLRGTLTNEAVNELEKARMGGISK